MWYIGIYIYTYVYIYTVSLLYCIYVCLYSAVVVSPRLFPHPKRHELLALVAHGHHAHFRCGVLPPMALACWENCWEKVARKSIQNCDWTPQLLERMLQILNESPLRLWKMIKLPGSPTFESDNKHQRTATFQLPRFHWSGTSKSIARSNCPSNSPWQVSMAMYQNVPSVRTKISGGKWIYGNYRVVPPVISWFIIPIV